MDNQKLLLKVLASTLQVNKKLYTELKTLNSNVSILSEALSQGRTAPKLNEQKNTNPNPVRGQEEVQEKLGQLRNLLEQEFENPTDFSQEGGNIHEEYNSDTKSILDYNISDPNDPTAKILDKIKNTDYRKAMDSLERASGRRG